MVKTTRTLGNKMRDTPSLNRMPAALSVLAVISSLWSMPSHGAVDRQAANAQSAHGDSWSLTLAPYVWAPDLSGSVGFGGINVPLQLRASQLFKDVQTGGMGYARWQKHDHFVYLEGIFIDFSANSFAPFFGQSVESSLRFGEFGAGTERGIKLMSRDARLSAYGGVRYTRLKARVAGNFLNAESVDRWIDPALGILLEVPVADRFSIITKIDAAGFGISKNHYYSALGVLEYRVTKRATLAGGYRWASAHYASADGLGFVLDGRGPMAGLRYVISAYAE